MSGFAKIKRGCCFVRFQPCQDSESRGDLDNGDLMFSDTGIGSKYYRGKIWMEIFTRESGNQKGYNLSDRKNTRISLWSYFGGRSMASSLEHFCLIKDSVTLGLNREVINMKKKFWLTLYNIGVSILFLLSLYKSHGRLFFIFSAGSFWRNCGKGFYWMQILAGESRDKRGYSLSNHESIAIAFWNYLDHRSMADSF